jgi:hypothetical protein
MFTYNLNQTQLDKRITPPLAEELHSLLEGLKDQRNSIHYFGTSAESSGPNDNTKTQPLA